MLVIKHQFQCQTKIPQNRGKYSLHLSNYIHTSISDVKKFAITEKSVSLKVSEFFPWRARRGVAHDAHVSTKVFARGIPEHVCNMFGRWPRRLGREAVIIGTTESSSGSPQELRVWRSASSPPRAHTRSQYALFNHRHLPLRMINEFPPATVDFSFSPPCVVSSISWKLLFLPIISHPTNSRSVRVNTLMFAIFSSVDTRLNGFAWQFVKTM